MISAQCTNLEVDSFCERTTGGTEFTPLTDETRYDFAIMEKDPCNRVDSIHFLPSEICLS